MEILQNLQPYEVFKYFEEISNIPRGSGNEKAISDYLVNFGKNLGLETIQDKALNVIIKKPATKGYENAPTVIIQGHMDMVCEKNKDTEHDFTKDPIKLVVKGDEIYADGTTLGADNGIAVAYAMAVLADNSIEHPAIEVLLTTDEETGMTGAMNINKDDIQGKILLNIDSEEEGYLLVSCAGGIRTKSSLDITWEALNDEKIFEISVRGLKGGHSGSDIHEWRGNSNKLMGRVLKDLLEKIDYKIVSINGGSKNNAIPREADGILAIKAADEEKLVRIVETWDKVFKKELEAQDPGVSLTVKEVSVESKKAFNKETTEKAVNLLFVYPNGVNTMSRNIDGLVESSTNIGILTTTDSEVIFDSAVRSSVPSLRADIEEKVKTITELAGAKYSANDGYPGWEYKADSKVREICKDVYKNMYGEEPVVYALHAGVECGLFEEILGDLDMISFGPNIRGAHTPEEHLSISSTKKVWEYLLEVLKAIK